MNERDRVIETLLFGSPDRVPLHPGNGRESTMARWHREGLPKNINTRYGCVKEAFHQAGGTLLLPDYGPGFDLNERMIPLFEEKVIERKERSQIVQDWKGNICEIGNEYSFEHLRTTVDFVTRRWIKCPVESWRDWEDMRKRYDPDDPSRQPDCPIDLAKILEGRDYPVKINIAGPFWQLREWLGFEELCMRFYDDTKLIEEMLSFWCDFISQLLKNTLKIFVPDIIHISEDMAYKNFSMISPSMTRKFLLPIWKQWAEIVKTAGVPIYAIDSDGFIGELIPIWIEAGFDGCDPIEVAAGNDIVQFRRDFGRNMAYSGGIDKRAIAVGGEMIEKEINRIQPVMDDGGYIPGCDHGVPSDVSWPNFCYYVKLLAKATGWL